MDAATVSTRVEQLKDREQRIGILRSLVDLCLSQEHQPVLEKPIVSMKELCSDFIVREVSQATGSALELEAPLPTPSTTGKVSAGRKRTREQSHTEPASADHTEAVHDVSGPIRDAFKDLVTEEELALLAQLVPQDLPKVVITSVTEKAKRGLIHAAVKQCFAGTHISTTEDGCVAVVKATAADRREERRRSNPIKSRPYLHFTLYKENMDSAHAFRCLAKSLHVSTRQFQYCGTKDKRAVTLQRVAIRDMAAPRLAVVNEHTFGNGTIKVCSFTEEPDGLRLGDALGNRFEIVLRCLPLEGQTGSEGCENSNSRVSDAWLASVTHALSTVGAINYFGPQRFGTTKVLTSEVGLLLLRGEFEAALHACLESKACFTPDVAHALAPLKEHRYEEALAALPHFCFQERDMLKHLVTYPNDFMGTFLTLPRTLAMLYFHAVQSLAWNTIASARLSDASRLRAEVGDIVLETVYRSRTESNSGAGVVRASALPVSEADQALPAVRRLTAEDPLDRFALSDILLPLPGPDQDLVFPSSAGCTKSDYETTLTEMGVQEALLPRCSDDTSDHGRTNALVKVFHFHGAYRPLCLVPADLSLTHHVVSSWRAPANQSDLQRLGATSETATEAATTLDASKPCECIVARFTLLPGSYATSVLREFAMLCTEGFHAGDAATPVNAEDGDPEVAAADTADTA